jgi:NAD(P)-dependent dehydrogenase (short-subunit alcohol dehydrogenase family)
VYNFSGEVALVTGGGDVGDHTEAGLGIGATICEVLARNGARVGVVDRSLGHARTTVARIEAAGGSALAVEADVSVESDCREAVAAVVASFGRLDIVVTGVGIESYPRTDAENGSIDPPLVSEVAAADWDRTMDVNVKGMMLMAKHAAPHLGQGSSIVTIGSTGALRPARATSAYATSKGAVLSLTYALAVDLAPTRANCVSPGRVWTPIAKRKLPPHTTDAIRAQRFSDTLVGTEGSALDIANAVAFLASNDARWITGQHLVVDGGAGLGAGLIDGRSSGWARDLPTETT